MSAAMPASCRSPTQRSTLSAVSARCTWFPSRFGSRAKMVRVLRLGGRIAVLTSCAPDAAPTRTVLSAGARCIGLTMFDRHAFVDLFSSAGLVDIEQQTQRALQFVAAGKPG